jgi:membrane dipeptidase
MFPTFRIRHFYDALEVSRAPLIASHSSCRAISNNSRNISDDMIRALASKGGVVLINFNRIYLSQDYNDAFKATVGDNSRSQEVFQRQCGDDEFCQLMAQERLTKELMSQGKLPHVGWEKIIEHIQHVVELVGADHVGLGSDFDGANMPDGMEDASHLPNITEGLVRAGYSDSDIQKILGGNILRVMEEAERIGRESAGSRTGLLGVR